MGTVVTYEPKYVTVVGSRETPELAYRLQVEFTQICVNLGFIIRTGDARLGGDKAARAGSVHGERVIYTPVERNRPYHVAGPSLPTWSDALDIAASIHPVWHRLSTYVRALHARNVFQVLGCDIQTPSDFMIFWAPIVNERQVKGGTNTAFQVALDWGVPCFNLADRNQVANLKTMLAKLAAT